MASIQVVVFFFLAVSLFGLYETEARHEDAWGALAFNGEQYYHPHPPHQRPKLPKKPKECNEFDNTLLNLVVDSGKVLINKLCEASMKICVEHNKLKPAGMLRAVTREGCMEVRRTCSKLAQELDLTGDEQVPTYRPKKPNMLAGVPMPVPNLGSTYARPIKPFGFYRPRPWRVDEKTSTENPNH